MSNLKLGDYFKAKYESNAALLIEPKRNVIMRLDGVAFHTFTKKFDRPFDRRLGDVMMQTAMFLCENIAGCVLAYTQSDEISLLINDLAAPNTQPWFGYKPQKLISVPASMTTYKFNQLIDLYTDMPAYFDNRVIVVNPEDADDVPLYFKWRVMDAIRNSKLGFASMYMSHSRMHGINTLDLVKIVREEFGANWEDVPAQFRFGKFVAKREAERPIPKEHYDASDPNHIMTPEGPMIRRKAFFTVDLDEDMVDKVNMSNPDMKLFFERNIIKYKE